MRRITSLGLIGWWLTAGCASGDDAPAPATTSDDDEGPTYWRDVKPVLDARCISCHQAGGIGPFELTTYDEVASVAPLVAASVRSGQMPPWRAVDHRPYLDDPSLTDAQIEAIAAWDAAGAPEGDPSSEGPTLPPIGGAVLDRIDHTLTLPAAYEVTGDDGGDDYRCFLVDWPDDDNVFVTGFEAVPANDRVVHHMAAFLLRSDGPGASSVIDTFQGWQEREEGPGYGCFGGPSATGEELDAPTLQIAQWVPGSGAVTFPEGTGIEVPAGSKVVLQMHYYTGGLTGEIDQSEIHFTTSPSVERVAAFAPFLDPLWPLAGMDIPAGSVDHEHSYRSDPSGFLALFLAGFDLSGGFDVHSTMMHMHRLGSTATLRHHRSDGEADILLEVEDWDFDWQLDYRFAEPVAFRPGDELEVTCTWSNPTDEDRAWGEGSDQEMCVANMYISEPR